MTLIERCGFGGENGSFVSYYLSVFFFCLQAALSRRGFEGMVGVCIWYGSPVFAAMFRKPVDPENPGL
ncbi:MAG: hypothetical protein RIK87_03825 [Fuerstiella sp.]